MLERSLKDVCHDKQIIFKDTDSIYTLDDHDGTDAVTMKQTIGIISNNSHFITESHITTGRNSHEHAHENFYQ